MGRCRRHRDRDGRELRIAPRRNELALNELALIEAPAMEHVDTAIAGGATGRLTLRANFSWTLLSSVAYAACQWGMLILLAKLGSPEMVGQFTLGLAITAPVLMFTNLQLRYAQATDAKGEYAFGDYLTLRILSTLLALIVIVGLVVASVDARETAAIVLLVGLGKLFEALSDLFYGLLQHHERMDHIGISMILKGVLSLLILGLALVLTHRLLWGAVGLAAVPALVFACYDIPKGRQVLARAAVSVHPGGGLRPQWAPRTLARLVKLTLPLGLSMVLVSLNTNIPRYFIEHDLGTHDLGLFAALSYLMVAGYTLVGALGQAVTPPLARYAATEDWASFRRLLLRFVALGAAIGGAGITVALLAGQTLLLLLYRPEYAAHTEVFVWLMVAAGIWYAQSALNFGLTAARRFRVQVPLFAGVTLTTLIACAVLIPQWQLLGAAYALVLAMAVQCIATIIVMFDTVVGRKGAAEG